MVIAVRIGQTFHAVRVRLSAELLGAGLDARLTPRYLVALFETVAEPPIGAARIIGCVYAFVRLEVALIHRAGHVVIAAFRLAGLTIELDIAPFLSVAERSVAAIVINRHASARVTRRIARIESTAHAIVAIGCVARLAVG
jgi:hypothetical protein